MPQTSFSFTGSTYLYSHGDRRLGNWSASREHVGVGTVMVGAESSALIGMTSVTALTYYPTHASLVPNALGIQVTPVDGYVVDEVTAHSSVTWPAQELTVTERDGAYFVDTTELPLYFDRAQFTVQLREAVVLAGKEQCKDGGWSTSTSPAFPTQGQCVSFFASAASDEG